MSEQEILARVKDFAAEAHKGQKRKYTPEPYIVHPVRVMEALRKHTDDLSVLCAALLHDVLEDTPVNEYDLHKFLVSVMDENPAIRTLRLVVELSDVYTSENYPRFNRRQRKEMERNRIEKTSPVSQTIKYADIIDNCREIVKHDRDFARVFLSECRLLLKKIPSGNAELYRLAKQTLDENLEKIHSRS